MNYFANWPPIAMSPKISVIVPIHRTEQYLEKCVRSVLAQTFDDLEVLCVDDVSPDNSSAVIAALAESDSRVKLIQHEYNLGQGGARNTAIGVAQGTYIANVDSDDWIKPDMLEVMYKATKAETVDLVCCGYDRVNESDELLKEFALEARLIDNTDLSVDIFELLNPALWNKLFRKSLCTDNNILFPNYLNFEDLATTPRLVCESNSINIIDDKLYNYVSRENSVVSTYSAKHMLDCFDAFSVLRQYLKDKKLFAHYHGQFLAMVDKHLRFRLNGLMRSELSDEQKQSHMRYYVFLKWSFLENADVVQSMDSDALRAAVISSVETDAPACALSA